MSGSTSCPGCGTKPIAHALGDVGLYRASRVTGVLEVFSCVLFIFVFLCFSSFVSDYFYFYASYDYGASCFVFFENSRLLLICSRFFF